MPEQESPLRSAVLMGAVLWPVLFILLGLVTGDFDGGNVARSLLFAVAIAAGSAMARRRRPGG